MREKLETKYKDPVALHMVNNATGMIETIKQYLRSCYGVEKTPLAHIVRNMVIVRKMVIVQRYGNHLQYMTPNDKMIARMLHLPKDSNRICYESVIKNHTT